jgi:NADPH-dependent curcumin reductase
VLARAPAGAPVEEDFRLCSGAAPEQQAVPGSAPKVPLGAGDLLVRVLDLSIDPYLRGAIAGRHLGSAPVGVGDVLPGRAVARVEVAAGPFRTGDLVLAETGWQEWAVVPATAAEPVDVPPGVRPSAALGVLGMPGLTAYAAVVRLMRLTPGDTVVISAATGAVGATAGQLATLAGCRTIAIVGGERKVRLATEELGYAAAVDRLAPDWPGQLREYAPNGVDAYLDNAGGDVLSEVVSQLAIGGRVVLCGLMSQYNDGPPTTLAAGTLIGRRATVHGLVVYDHEDLWPRFRAHVGDLLRSGRLHYQEDRRQGLEAAPGAFCDLMRGRNLGKVVVEVAT